MKPRSWSAPSRIDPSRATSFASLPRPAGGASSHPPGVQHAKGGKCGGPSGIRTQDRRIKSQWLQLQNSPKTASKNRETAGKQLQTAGKRQVSGHLPDTKWRQWRHLKRGGNAGLRPKEHTCANIATVRALAAAMPEANVNRSAVVACQSRRGLAPSLAGHLA